MSRFIASIGLFSTLFLLFSTSELVAQKSQLRDSLVQDFRSGTLIIRLKSHENKLDKIEEIINRADTSPNYRKRLTEKRDLIIANRDRFNQDLVTSFDKIYTYSAVKFMYDRDIKRFQAGEMDRVFLGTDLQPLAESSSVVGSYYYFGEGVTQVPGNSREGLLVMDKNGDQLPSWFPSFFRAKNNVKGFFSMFGGDRYDYLQAEKVVEKFLKKLGGL